MARRKGKLRKTATGKDIPPAEYRVATAQRLLLDECMSSGETSAYIQKQYQVSSATAERDIAYARKLIADDAERERPMLRARETHRLSRIATKAEGVGRFEAAVAAVRGLAKINGLEVQVVAVGGSSAEQQAMLDAVMLTPTARQTKIEELRARIAARSTNGGASSNGGVQTSAPGDAAPAPPTLEGATLATDGEDDHA